MLGTQCLDKSEPGRVSSHTPISQLADYESWKLLFQKMHAKSESDVSIATSSSIASPRPHVYYVQSPSRHSQEDVDKSSSSLMYSPLSRHSRSSSSDRLSVNWRWMTNWNRRRNSIEWGECNVIDEEEEYDSISDHDQRFKLSQRCFLGLMVLVAMFGMLCLIIWGASRLYKTQIIIKSLKVHNFDYSQGADRTGVPTMLLTVNCSVRMEIYNPATFFGIHVSSNSISLIYSELPVATGQIKTYYQPKKSKRNMIVNLEGQRVPLYGAGDTLGLAENGGVPMKLDFRLQSRGNLVGKLVKTKRHIHIFCSMDINSRSTKEINFMRGSCRFS